MKITIRLFMEGQRQEWPAVDAEEWNATFIEFLLVNQERLANTAHLFEIEFLDEPDPAQRFFRWGTDPRGMVLPMLFPPYADQN